MSVTKGECPPIPVSCARRPTTGGLVIPWVNVQLADGGVDFRSQHETRFQQCWRDCLCQICSCPVDRPIVLVGGPRQLDMLTFDEPPMHPECAVYVSKACPMVAGRMPEYRTGDTISHGARGSRCSTPGCNCGGWVSTPGVPAKEGARPAHDWYAVYVSGYALGVVADRPDRIHSGVVKTDQVLGVRHISAPGRGRIWARVPAPDGATA